MFGPSGSGKSTFMSLAAGLDRPSAGEIRAFGRSLGVSSEDELAAYRASEVAIVFQSDNLWPALTAGERGHVVAAGGDGAGHGEAELRLPLRPRQACDHRAAALSGGEQQRVAVAVAAARRARLVLADEPTGELDAAQRAARPRGTSALREEIGSDRRHRHPLRARCRAPSTA